MDLESLERKKLEIGEKYARELAAGDHWMIDEIINQACELGASAQREADLQILFINRCGPFARNVMKARPLVTAEES